jgi:hypothetical protein
LSENGLIRQLADWGSYRLFFYCANFPLLAAENNAQASMITRRKRQGGSICFISGLSLLIKVVDKRVPQWGTLFL